MKTFATVIKFMMMTSMN